MLYLEKCSHNLINTNITVFDLFNVVKKVENKTMHVNIKIYLTQIFNCFNETKRRLPVRQSIKVKRCPTVDHLKLL